jgi:polyhydroxyalkanoate synthase subunit PhaC
MDTASASVLGPLRDGFERADLFRRQLGQWLEALGPGPVETPGRTVCMLRGAELRAYDDVDRPRHYRPALLIIPAPIKQHYIWDLAPEASAVRRCLEAGLHVYLIRWTEPDLDQGIDDYAHDLLAASVDAIASDFGAADRIVLAGHSLGGTLAAIFAAVRPDAARALILLEAPLPFGGRAAGAFAPLLEIDPAGLRLHLRVERWALDELPLSGRFFADVIERLYRRDQFRSGTLRIAGRPARPESIAAPVLCVYDPRSRIVPPASILPFVEALRAAAATRLLRYDGDVGVALQHVGSLVGRNAHRRLWPAIRDWMRIAGTMS